MKKIIFFILLFYFSYAEITISKPQNATNTDLLEGKDSAFHLNYSNFTGFQSTNTLFDIPENVSQSQAEFGTNPFVFLWSPETVAQAIDDQAIASISSSVDNSILRFDGITGKVIDDSGVTIDDIDQMGGITVLSVDNLKLDGNTISVTNAGGLIILGDDLDANTQNLSNVTVLFMANGGTWNDNTGEISMSGGQLTNADGWFVGNGRGINFEDSDGWHIDQTDGIDFETSIGFKWDSSGIDMSVSGGNIIFDGVGFITNLSEPTFSNAAATKFYVDSATVHIGGNFVDTNDQPITNVSTAQKITFSTSKLIDGMSHISGTSIFTIDTDGVYDLIIAPQLMQTGGTATAEFWIRKNSVDIDSSGVQETISASSESLPSFRWKERFVATDTFEIIWASDSLNTLLDNITSLYGGPNIPSIELGITHVGN